MSNPPAGWYPDPTGQPNTIRWWNGTQWTNKTEKEDSAGTPAAPTAKSTKSTTAATGGTAAAETAAGNVTSSTSGAGAGAKNAAAKATEGKKVVQEPAKPQVKAEAKAEPKVASKAAEVGKAKPKPEPVKAEPVKAVPAEPVAKAEVSKPAAAKSAESKPPESKPAAKVSGDEAGDEGPKGPEKSSQGVTKASPWTGGGSTWTQPEQGTDDSTLQGDPTTGGATSATSGTAAAAAPQSGGQAWTPTADTATPWNQGAAAQTGAGHTTGQGSGQAAEQGAAGPWDRGGEQFHGQVSVQPVPTPQPPLSPLSPPFQRPDRSKEKGFPLIPVIAGAVVAVLIISVGVWYLVGRGDGKPSADPTTNTSTPGPTGTPTGTPTGGETIPPGQSRNPAIHQGARIASNAISFPRLRPPWSDRLRFVTQVEDSNGQRVLLQGKFDGTHDWYANIFVGALSTAVLFNGDPQASASDLALQLRSSLYGDIPITAKVTRNGAISRTGKQGWFVQQTITASSSKLTSPTLLLTVAVFDLGDGTAVAYVSDIPTNRNDLKVFEALVYKAVNVG